MENEIIEEETSEKQEETQTVGNILRNARLKQGKTLNDVADVLFIRRVYLEAIENVDYKKLPVEPYGLGYVRNYAEYLGLNSARIVQSFKETAMPATTGKKNLKAIGDEQKTNAPHLKHVIIGLAILIAAILGWKLYDKYSSAPAVEFMNDTPSAENYPTPVIIEETTQNIAVEDNGENQVEINTENDNKETLNSNENLVNDNENANEAETKTEETEQKEADAPRIKIVLVGDSWIELKHNNKVLLARVYHKGFEYEVPYNENLQVTVGKSNNVRFYIDGKLTKVTTPRNQIRVNLDKFLEKR